MLSVSCTCSHHHLQAICLPCRHLAVQRQSLLRVTSLWHCLYRRARAQSVFTCTCLLDLTPLLLQKPVT